MNTITQYALEHAEQQTRQLAAILGLPLAASMEDILAAAQAKSELIAAQRAVIAAFVHRNNALTPEQREALARLDAAETLPALKPDGWPCT